MALAPSPLSVIMTLIFNWKIVWKCPLSLDKVLHKEARVWCDSGVTAVASLVVDNSQKAWNKIIKQEIWKCDGQRKEMGKGLKTLERCGVLGVSHIPRLLPCRKVEHTILVHAKLSEVLNPSQLRSVCLVMTMRMGKRWKDKDWSNKEQEEWLTNTNFIPLNYRLVPPQWPRTHLGEWSQHFS